MTRADLQALADERIADAQCFLAGNRWGGAYYLAGYSVEAGLKSCLLSYIEKSGRLFKDKNYAKSLSESWTHDLSKLIDLAGLKEQLEQTFKLNTPFNGFWGTTKDRSEVSRYDTKTKEDAEELIEAITNEPHGVLPWIKQYW